MTDGNRSGFGDDPTRGPLNRPASAMTGGTGGAGSLGSGTSDTSSTYSGGGTVSAMFDSQSEAQQAVSALRSAGVDDSSLSVIAKDGRTTTARDGTGEVTDESHENILRGILGGGVLGAGLGVAALAIPGVGPLVAAGAIAASAVPGAMAIGAAAGAAAGTVNETLKAHGVSDEDADYYGEHLTGGGVLVTVSGSGATDQARDILRRNGGHSASSPRMASV